MKTLAFLFLLTTALFAEPFTTATLTLGSKTYQAASITLENPQTALIRHASGTARVLATTLPSEILTKIGFDPAAAAAFAKQQSEKADADAAIQRAAAAWAKAPEQKFEVLSNTQYGLIVWNYRRTTKHTAIASRSATTGGGNGYALTETVFEALNTRSFIPHTAETQTLPVGQMFMAKTIANGTTRVDESDLLPTQEVRQVRLIKSPSP